MRIFLGIKLPEKTAKLIQKSIVPLQQKYYTARWVQPKNFHLTVTFIGEVPDYKKLIPKIEKAIFDVRPFTLDLKGGGIFQRDALVLFIEAYRQKALEKLAEDLNIALLHRPLEYRYIPHITIGRARNPSKQQYVHMKKLFEELEIEHNFEVHEITLFKSELKGGDLLSYEELVSFKLEE